MPEVQNVFATYGRCKVRMKAQPYGTSKQFSDVLIHYGVSGMRKGQRRWQNADGSYTAEGREHYGIGDPRQKGASILPKGVPRTRERMGTKSGPRMSSRPPHARTMSSTQGPRARVRTKSTKPMLTPEQQAARKKKVKKFLIGAGAVALAAAAGYAAYKGSTNLRDSMRKDIVKNMSQGHDKIQTLHSKYWDAADRKKYGELTKNRANLVANNFTRRDAIASKIYEKTGVRLDLNLPTRRNREKFLEDRRSSQELSNFIRDAEKRGNLNKQIHDARQELKSVKDKAATYAGREKIGVSKQYEQQWNAKNAETIKRYQERLNDLLNQRMRRPA